MVRIRDPIHGDLEFDGVIEKIICTDEFQRLASVKQLGLIDKVYPGATHTRFAHSIGTCHLAGMLASQLGIPSEDRLLLMVAALLHDVGHYDFSHALEQLVPWLHEENGKKIILGEAELPYRPSGGIKQVLVENSIPPERIIRLLEGTGAFSKFYYTILSGEVIDVDRMDYLKRDTYYTGAVIGEIDISRLLQMIVVKEDTQELGIQEKGVASLEQFLMARLHMYWQVYLHPDAHVGEAMLTKAALHSLDVAQPFLYGDEHLLTRLLMQGGPLTRQLVSRINKGKKAFYQPALVVDSVSESKRFKENVGILAEREKERPGLTEHELISATGVDEAEIVVTFSEPKERAMPAFPVCLRDGSWADLFDISPLSRAVFHEHAMKRMFGVYTLPQHVDAVRRAAIRLLETQSGT